MSFRFRRTFSILPGLRANITKTGASLSIGPRGAKLTVGSGGVRATAGLPGTGMFWSEQITHKGHADAGQSAEPQLSLPPEVEEVIRERPPHWEYLLIQRALRSAVNDIDARLAIASSHGTDAITFHEWLLEFPDNLKDLIDVQEQVIKAKIPNALGPPPDADRLVDAVDQFIWSTHAAIAYQERVAALARHPLYGDLAKTLANLAQPFVQVFKDYLQGLDDQLPNVDVTHRVDIHLTMVPAVSVPEFDAAQDAYGRRFFDSNHNLKSGDVVAERFRIARGGNELGRFSRAAIADNLANNIFSKDDLYWSEDANAWQPLVDILL